MGTPTNDLDQVDRFKELARELGCDEGEAAFEAALKKVSGFQGETRRKKRLAERYPANL